MLFKVSRPRFWIYLLGPYLIGLAAAGLHQQSSWTVLLMGLYFMFPANLLIYGVNDLFDYETDKRNPKKQSYEALVTPEKRRQLVYWILAINIPFLIYGLLAPSTFDPLAARWALAGFVFFGVFYSAPPIRAKTLPLLDSAFNILYVFPGIYAYVIVTGMYPPLAIIAAAGLWCMAMHAFSAIPDIKADAKAGISTIATWLGTTKTLWFCLGCYVLTAILAWPYLGGFGGFIALVYAVVVGLLLRGANEQSVFSLYRLFPYLNIGVGAALFWWIAIVK